jgi:cation:H+ antiporter
LEIALIIAILSVVGGLFLLAFAGDKLVDGAVQLGRILKLSDIFIGIVIIGFGTSLPEMMAGVVAAKQESAALVLGNMIGSNIANIGLVLAVGLLIVKHTAKERVHSMALDYTLMILAGIIFEFLLYSGDGISSVEGAMMLVTLVILLCGSYVYATKTHIEAPLEYDEDDMSPWKAWLFVLLGIVGLYAGAELLINGAITIASSMGISERVIGLTVVAVGTSLPELAATFAAARKSGLGLILGNVCGSNMFNLLAGVGLAATVYPLPSTNTVFDVVEMSAFSLAMMALFFIPGKYFRVAGIVLLIGYAVYLSILGIS